MVEVEMRQICSCRTCFLKLRFCRQHIRFKISDDDFVKKKTLWILFEKKKRIDPKPPTSDDEFVPCTYTGKTSTSSIVTDPEPVFACL